MSASVICTRRAKCSSRIYRTWRIQHGTALHNGVRDGWWSWYLAERSMDSFGCMKYEPQSLTVDRSEWASSLKQTDRSPLLCSGSAGKCKNNSICWSVRYSEQIVTSLSDSLFFNCRTYIFQQAQLCCALCITPQVRQRGKAPKICSLQLLMFVIVWWGTQATTWQDEIMLEWNSFNYEQSCWWSSLHAALTRQ